MSLYLIFVALLGASRGKQYRSGVRKYALAGRNAGRVDRRLRGGKNRSNGAHHLATAMELLLSTQRFLVKCVSGDREPHRSANGTFVGGLTHLAASKATRPLLSALNVLLFFIMRCRLTFGAHPNRFKSSQAAPSVLHGHFSPRPSLL